MKHRWAAPLVVLALGALVPSSAAGQGTSPQPARERSPRVQLGQNYPNPFNPETHIPFTLGDWPECTDAGRQYRVTLQVFNVLAQLVAEPILQGGDEPGKPIRSLLLRCGEYTAYWDGKYRGSDQEVASGVYLYRLQVDGKVTVKKMLVTK
jgi:hypothetical protein